MTNADKIKIPKSPQQINRLREIGRRGAEATARRRLLESEGIDRPAPSLFPVNWINRPDPFDDA
jgi:hypothetical protein